MQKFLAIFALPVVIASTQVDGATAGDLSGVWQVMTLGGDRRVEVWQKDERIIAHRVMVREFEGRPYKLEHLFRGKINGADINGALYVREEGMKNFEELRPFNGRIEAADKLIFDGLPLKRGEGATAIEPPALKQRRRSGGPAPLSLRLLPNPEARRC